MHRPYRRNPTYENWGSFPTEKLIRKASVFIGCPLKIDPATETEFTGLWWTVMGVRPSGSRKNEIVFLIQCGNATLGVYVDSIIALYYKNDLLETEDLRELIYI